MQMGKIIHYLMKNALKNQWQKFFIIDIFKKGS